MVRKVFTPDEPVLPINYPGFVFRRLLEEGYAVGALLAETGLEESQLRDPHFRCGFQPLRQLFLNAMDQSGDPHLGVTMGLQFQPTYIGLPSYAAMNAEKFQDGLKVLERFFFLNFPAFELVCLNDQVALKKDEVAIRLRSKFPFKDIEYFGFSSAIVAINGLLKGMLRSDRAATLATMKVCRPDGWPAIEAMIGFPVFFEAPEHQIIFPAALLNRPLPGSDPINHARLVDLCEQFAKEMTFETTVVNQVISVIENAPNITAPVSVIAAELGYSERALRRQLARSGTSYSKLVDQVRAERARSLLAYSTQPIKVIAATLGFESSSNFARSFKRWTGLSPKAFREQARSLDQGIAGRK